MFTQRKVVVSPAIRLKTDYIRLLLRFPGLYLFLYQLIFCVELLLELTFTAG